MKVAELLEGQAWQGRWAAHQLSVYGASGDETAARIDSGDSVRILVATTSGILDLSLARSGPRSVPTYSAAGRLRPWPEVDEVDIRPRRIRRSRSTATTNGGRS